MGTESNGSGGGCSEAEKCWISEGTGGMGSKLTMRNDGAFESSVAAV
jgi:hypothetical protein